MENECTLHNFIVLAIFGPKINQSRWTFDKIMTKNILTVF